MHILCCEAIGPPDADGLWAAYTRSFAPLRTAAAQRHLFDRDEFDAVLMDTRVVKHVAYTDTCEPCGLSTITNDLHAVPLISREFFQARWPTEFAAGRIWYVGFLAVHPDYHGTGAIAQLIGSLCRATAGTGGVIAADICEYNEQRFRLPTAFGQLARTFTPGIRTERLDAQVYWAYEFPMPT